MKIMVDGRSALSKTEFKPQSEAYVERLTGVVKHISMNTVLSELLKDLDSEKLTEKLPAGFPEDTLIPALRTGKAYRITPSRFDTCVKLIKTLAIDRKKRMIVYCSRFSPKALMMGLISAQAGIPLRRLLTGSLKEKDRYSLSATVIRLKDIPVVFLKAEDLDERLLLTNLELLKDWFFPEVILFDESRSFHGEREENPSAVDPRQILAEEQSLAVVTVS